MRTSFGLFVVFFGVATIAMGTVNGGLSGFPRELVDNMLHAIMAGYIGTKFALSGLEIVSAR